MKSEFKTDDELIFLRKILHYMIMHTDNWLICPDAIMKGCKDYRKLMLSYREKAFEYLEEKDPNEYYIDLIRQQDLSNGR